MKNFFSWTNEAGERTRKALEAWAYVRESGTASGAGSQGGGESPAGRTPDYLAGALAASIDVDMALAAYGAGPGLTALLMFGFGPQNATQRIIARYKTFDGSEIEMDLSEDPPKQASEVTYRRVEGRAEVCWEHFPAADLMDAFVCKFWPGKGKAAERSTAIFCRRAVTDFGRFLALRLGHLDNRNETALAISAQLPASGVQTGSLAA